MISYCLVYAVVVVVAVGSDDTSDCFAGVVGAVGCSLRKTC